MVTISKIRFDALDDYENEVKIDYEKVKAYLYVNEALNYKTSKKLIIGCNLISSYFVYNSLMNNSFKLLGFIQIPSNQKIKNTGNQTGENDRNIVIYHSDDECTISCLVKIDVPDVYIYKVIDKLFSLSNNIEDVNCFTAAPFCKAIYKSNSIDLEAPFIRIINNKMSSRITPLEKGNFISGISAQIVNVCLAKNISFRIFILYHPNQNMSKSEKFYSLYFKDMLKNENFTIHDDLKIESDFLSKIQWNNNEII